MKREVFYPKPPSEFHTDSEFVLGKALEVLFCLFVTNNLFLAPFVHLAVSAAGRELGHSSL